MRPLDTQWASLCSFVQITLLRPINSFQVLIPQDLGNLEMREPRSLPSKPTVLKGRRDKCTREARRCWEGYGCGMNAFETPRGAGGIREHV